MKHAVKAYKYHNYLRLFFMDNRSTTVKVAIIGAISAVVVAIITGLFTFFTTPHDSKEAKSDSKETNGDCSPIISGTINGDYKNDCK